MKFDNGKPFSKKLLKLILGGLVTTVLFCNQSVFARPDYIFFSVNGDTTLSSLIQGDEFYWGSNCDTGATINWEIWYDVNSNSMIDPSLDFLLNSENITDGNAVTEPDPILDGWSITAPFSLSAEPGDYIFKATDIATDSAFQKIMTVVAMPSPPNQFTGQLILPGITAPNSLLANKVVFAESETGDEGVLLALTDNMGMYSMNVGAIGTGVEFFLGASNVNGFVAPGEISATASGVVGGNDFTYTAATDSVWGFVKDETGTLLNFETNVSAESESLWRSATTSGGRYAIYFSDTDNGNWGIEIDSRVSPDFLSPNRFEFNLDTVTSFEHDIVLTRSDAMIYARVTENGGLPVNNYRVDAYSASLAIATGSISGTGTDNLVTLHVSTLDPSGWQVVINQWDDDFPIPADLVVANDAFNVAPGDTVTLNLITGILVSGNVNQDPEDDPIFWDDVWVWADFYGANPDGGGFYSFYADTGTYYLSVHAEGYLTNPESRFLELTSDTTSGLDFIINEAHCRVSGTLTNVPLPLDNSYYTVVARTGTDNSDGYYVNAQVDSITGTYEMDLCDGNWTIVPPAGFPNVDPPESTIVAIGESPDTARTIDFEYVALHLCGDANGDDGLNIGDPVFLVNYVFKFGPTPEPFCTGDANGDGSVNVGDPVYLINYVFKFGPPPVEPCCP